MLQYIPVDQIIQIVAQNGPGALIATFDVETAYWNIAVHPEDHSLLSMKWRGQFYIERTLPFGLCSAPFIFNSVADMVEWILRNPHQVPDLLHYIDNFITTGPPQSPQCAENLSNVITICKRLGQPLHPNKCVGPAMSLTVLGIELDSIQQIARLPELQSWLLCDWCNRQEMESLTGHQHHTAKVVWHGKTFLCRMINLMCCC